MCSEKHISNVGGCGYLPQYDPFVTKEIERGEERGIKIAICGAGHIGGLSSSLAAFRSEHHNDLVIVGGRNRSLIHNCVEVNGELFIEKQSPKSYHPRSKSLEMAIGLANMYLGVHRRERPHVDIVKEYGLIKLKKSNLSSDDRHWVVNQFERKYEPFNDEQQ